MRISDWSSDVCSSDLHGQHDGELAERPGPGGARVKRHLRAGGRGEGFDIGGIWLHEDSSGSRADFRRMRAAARHGGGGWTGRFRPVPSAAPAVPSGARRPRLAPRAAAYNRESGVWGTRVSGRVEFGGARIIKK